MIAKAYGITGMEKAVWLKNLDKGSDIVQAFKQAVQFYRPKIIAKGLKLVENIALKKAYSPHSIYSIGMMFHGLLGDAFKYTAKGKISVELFKKDKNVIIKIADTGIGIPKGEQKKVFAIDYRGSNTRGIKGHGFSLTYTYRLLEIISGEIKVDSEVDKGTTFTVKLPYLD